MFGCLTRLSAPSVASRDAMADATCAESRQTRNSCVEQREEIFRTKLAGSPARIGTASHGLQPQARTLNSVWRTPGEADACSAGKSNGIPG